MAFHSFVNELLQTSLCVQKGVLVCAKLVFKMNAMCRECGKACSVSSFEFAKWQPAEGIWRDDRSHGDPVTRASLTGATTGKWPVRRMGLDPASWGVTWGTA